MDRTHTNSSPVQYREPSAFDGITKDRTFARAEACANYPFKIKCKKMNNDTENDIHKPLKKAMQKRTHTNTSFHHCSNVQITHQ